MINNLKELSKIVEKCNLNSLQGAISRLHYNIDKLESLIKNESEKRITIAFSSIPVEKSVIDYTKLTEFLNNLKTKFQYEKILPIYEKDCKKYNIYSKQLIKICNTLKKEIINDYQLIYLKKQLIDYTSVKKHISGFYRSAKNPIFVEIEIIAIKYLHKDLPKKSYFQGIKNNPNIDEYNPGIIFTSKGKQFNKTHKNFLNFLNQICIVTSFINLDSNKQKHHSLYNCDREEATMWVPPETLSIPQISANNDARAETVRLLAKLNIPENNADIERQKTKTEIEAVKEARKKASISLLPEEQRKFIQKNPDSIQFIPGYQNIFPNTTTPLASQFKPAYFVKRDKQMQVAPFNPSSTI